MARARTVIVCGVCLFAATPAVWGACRFQNDEIVNPFEPGCGDVILTYTESDNTGNNIALGYPVPIPVDSLTPVDGFRTYDSLFARHQSLDMLEEVDGHIVGQTVARENIWAYRLGDGDDTTAEGFAEGAVLVNGGIHAREWQTPEAVTGLMEAMVDGKADGGFGQYLIENLTTVLLPVNNVDGFRQTQRFADRTTADRLQPRDGRMRRKNMRNPQTQGAIDEDLATVGDNFWGIDLNRNSPDGFAQGGPGNNSGSETSLIYRGTSPATEPEIAALQTAATLAPAARLRLYSDTHSFGQVYLAPTTGNARRNSITAQLAARMRAASMRGYAFAADPAGWPGIGTTADYFAFTHSVPSWTLELEPANGGQDYGGLATHGHSGFVLPDDQAARMREDVARMYLLGFYRQAGPPAVLAAQIRDRDSDQVVYEAEWQQASAVARTLATSTNAALVPGRNYRLWVAFNKPMRIRDDAGNVVAYRGQTSGASVGTVTLEFPDLTGQDLTLAVAAGDAWLAAPGGAPGGFLRYRDDAFAVDFTLPADLPVTGATGSVLSLSVRDLADMALDANPATAADWESGHWVRLEDSQNAESDIGGIDCSFKPFAAPQDGAAPPAGSTVCAAATPPPPAASTAAFLRGRWRRREVRLGDRRCDVSAAWPPAKTRTRSSAHATAGTAARMMHSVTLITTIAAGFGLALIFGFLAVRLGLPALIGYLLAGVVLGPATPGYVADLEIAGQLAEIGVMLLMFGVGLHFSFQDLLSVRRIALPGAIVQIAVATALGAGLASLWGWKLSSGIVFGFALSVASTVVLLRALESRGELESVNGRIAVGWLVVEDLVTVLVLVLMPPLAAVIANPGSMDGGEVLRTLARTIGEIGVFVVLMLVVGRRLFPWLLWQVARTGSRELFTLCVIAAALGIAYGSSVLFGASFALGAFFAGMVLRESDLSYRAAQESLPLRDAFAVLFFVSVGMLFDPAVVLTRPLEVLAVVTVILVGKSVAAFLLVITFRYPLNTALTVSASLAQIGEFSFILAGLGVTLGLLPVEGQNYILAGAIISIALNPIVFRTIEPAERWLKGRAGLARWLARRPDPLAVLPAETTAHGPAGHVVLVGYGRVGRRIGQALIERGLPFVVVEQNRELVEKLREQGVQAVAGDAADRAELEQAHVARARMLVIAIPDAFQARQMIETARTLNPGIETVVRTHSEEEAELLSKEHAGKVFMGEHELAVGMARHVLERVAP